ncbi:hypothetical protein A3742_00490 [Oleiphilus sp. HI0071]|uniref:PEGA domain-containing protein n=1 Tax=Oleiphilus sp. HI0080 TaxID=1822255 RepID=UPI0007C36C56|nr:PEGA domain-containing protein [Oleiphilus sp. HI0080]KZY67293.1 hypothetical protein A3737_13510 [Oleiphilus sp. HI0065]KZY84644.1 hypothetical protein A3742_00490 [Oleiphilus sp. HI0071]KZY91830.1 hypothetical protein A3744_03025 [Oleiphilus sp. HI0073]KZZ48687.1 hypothetical protein A3760_03315 [Oleiphilus sp. HI0122]KZZ49781.1 hypothetical protein A3758_13045 [Oleiphilus sp. HI0118]KZZ79172.1 hypothetical protein A3767_11755 [Oleiphilus sp. HI0133]
MVDIRPLAFINFLMLLLLASAGFVQLQENAAQNTEQSLVTDTAADATHSDSASTPDLTVSDNPSQQETLNPQPEQKHTESESPIFVDQLPEGQTPSVVDRASSEPSKPEINKPQPEQVKSTGSLTVRSNVYGDTVLINGKPYGSSALEVELNPGTYEVEVTKGGFQNWRQSIYITRGSEQTIVAELQKFTTVNYRNGVWENGVQTGEGRYLDGARIDYQGSFVNGQFHGYGSARYGDGSRYQGEWFEGERKGNGTFVNSTGDTYIGQFSNDEFNGDGTLTKANGDIYTGYWIGGELNGQGSLTTRDGMLYVGGFSDNLFHGNGTLTYPDGGTYEGSFSNGLFHGKGVEVYANGKKYEGQFIEGLYHGKGEILNPNGSKISGTFKDGEPFGKVTLTTAEGEVFTARSSEPGVCYRPKSYRATECPKLDGW